MAYCKALFAWIDYRKPSKTSINKTALQDETRTRNMEQECWTFNRDVHYQLFNKQ